MFFFFFACFLSNLPGDIVKFLLLGVKNDEWGCAKQFLIAK